MKRIVLAAIAAVPIVLVPAMALAQEGSDLGAPGGAEVLGSGGSSGGVSGVGGVGGSAFTGAEVAGLIMAAAALVVLGIALVMMTRRRAARSVTVTR